MSLKEISLKLMTDVIFLALMSSLSKTKKDGFFKSTRPRPFCAPSSIKTPMMLPTNKIKILTHFTPL